MTKKEALDFLELSESASDSEIKAKLADKLSYFELLSEKSPSVFLRRIQEQNVAKVKLIQKESVQWSEIKEADKLPFIPEPEQKPVSNISVKVDSQPRPEPAPYQDPAELSRTQVRAKPGSEPAGWLVRHTENKSIKSFPVFAGKNFIGRKIQPGLKPFIEVEEDLFVSRVHAVLYVEGAAPYSFFISDTSSSNGGKPSKNGTYINGGGDRINGKIILHDYDTVQIGETKFVLRFDITDILKMQEEVEDKGYMHTVVIKPDRE
jgi:FHA domain